ncbi:MAG TPA: DUF3761 domain-containing protein [Gemmatimonadaceae bacterium]|nr:DUF3761 domain-containing protein [Gemmatimonadaceae bacterium]
MNPLRNALVIVALVFTTVGLNAQSARCRDGSLSYSTSRAGTCARHGGVAEWLSSGQTTPTPPPAKTPAVTPAAAAPAPAPVTPAVKRDARGRIQRSAAARHAFARQTGYPNGRPGYVIDHIIPLACGGADTPANMQWQTIAEGKAKDRTERANCR